MSALNTEKLSVGYGRRIIVDNIDFEVHQGEILTLIGANGSGKSTILKSILSHLEIISGSIFIEGKHIREMKRSETAKKMSAVMTEHIEPELMTCGDIVELGRYPYTGKFGILSADDRRIVREAMELVGVENLENSDFGQISDGQRQRIMLARAICQQPEILVLDEPTSFLDVHHKTELLNILKRLVREKNLAVVMSLHELDLAQKISDRIVCINNNTAERIGTPEEIFSGNYIARLYGMNNSFDYNYCSAELEKSCNSPEVFVIGGSPEVYRKLQRKNIAFYTGVIHENSIEFPAARALAAEVVAEKAFEPIGETALKKAAGLLEQCTAVINACEVFGTMNRRNSVLLETAEKLNIPVQNI